MPEDGVECESVTIIFIHCMKNNNFVKTLNINIICSWFSGNDRNIIFSVKRKLKKNLYNFYIFSTISDSFCNRSKEQDNDKKKKKKMIRGLNAVPRRWEI